MTHPYSAGASRRSAVFTAIIGLHFGVFLLIAVDQLPAIIPRDRAAKPPEVTILPPKPQPHVAVRPDRSDPINYRGETIVEPDVVIAYVEEDTPAVDAIDQDTAGAGVAERPAAVEFIAPRLRMKGERLAALVKSCYPPASRRAGEEGRALVRLLVGSNGSVRSWSLAQGTGFPRLDAAVDCIIAKLVIEPGRRDGRAIEAEALLPIVYRLD